MKTKKLGCVTYIVLAYIIGFICLASYKFVQKSKIDLKESKVDIYVPTGAILEDVGNELVRNKVVENTDLFNTYAKLYGYKTVRSGRYIVKKGMSYKEVIRLLASGRQTPVNLVISGNIRLKDRLAGIIAKQIESDSMTILSYLNDEPFLDSLGFTPSNSILLFLPNTYNVYWNRDPKQLFKDMKQNYDKFWAGRESKLDSLGLTKLEVMTIASIIVEESAMASEYPRIAGVYVNRLKKNMLLQADPTVKYAVGDFSIKRVLTVHTQTDSPYNTYKYTGIPPGPICIPPVSAIDGVLNYENHEYIYFCANSDFSGSHIFAKTLSQHNQNAAAYRSALNSRQIFK